MPDNSASPRRVSPLLPGTGEPIVDYPRLRLRERPALSAIQVLCYRGKHEAAAQAIRKAIGIDC